MLLSVSDVAGCALAQNVDNDDEVYVDNDRNDDYDDNDGDDDYYCGNYTFVAMHVNETGVEDMDDVASKCSNIVSFFLFAQPWFE